MSNTPLTGNPTASVASNQQSYPRGRNRPGPSNRQAHSGPDDPTRIESGSGPSTDVDAARPPRTPRTRGGAGRGRSNNASGAGEPSGGSLVGPPHSSHPPFNRPRAKGGPNEHPTGDAGAQDTQNPKNAPRPPRRRNRPKPSPSNDAAQSSRASTPLHSTQSAASSGGPVEQTSAPGNKPRQNRRGAKFGGSLTEPIASSEKAHSGSGPSQKYRSAAPKKNDLTSTLIHALSTPPYPDCLICFSAIHPLQPTWSCSPSMPATAATDDEGEGTTRRETASARCCWTTFHLKCIRSWASKSVKDVVEAWRARGESRTGEWRCPGCQSKRIVVPSGYWCFCGSTPDPKPRLGTPHSCGSPCSRPRVCGHPCPISCHPGPCPPCQVSTQLPCYCGKQTLSFLCSHLAPDKTGARTTTELSCGRVCGRKLGCGNHTCEGLCHPGKCEPCPVREVARCYCGKEERELGCGEGEEKACAVIEDGSERRWVGRFTCEEVCGRFFDCGLHRCSKPCHPPSLTAALCPRSPSLVTHCPCGKHELTAASAAFFPPGTSLNRTACADPIPTCESTCMKPLEGCEHACAMRCHTGPCPPCSIMLVRPCRCGATTRNVRCSEDQDRARALERGEADEILCDRPCGALRACGRHQCNRICCPLASLAGTAKGKGKKRAGMLDGASLVDEAGWHECDLVCGKMLGCGNHRCEERDHRGVCPPCLRSSFEEMVCYCGRTVLEPPIPCGTRMNCIYPCSRPPLPCGHPKMPHACHEDPEPCPPCPFLTSKKCACGKKLVENVKCSQEKVSCGTPCGKLLLSCGFHHCERLCHNDPCGPCTAICGKPRKLCLPADHPCALPCHAPAACDESEPCRQKVDLTCPCGRIRQPISCGRSTANPAGREGSQQLKCTNECLMAKRNARLAEALGINPDRGDGRDKQITYNDDVLAFARANPKFAMMVEKSFADFLSSDKKLQVLAHMPEHRRKFVHDLAAVYRMDTQMVDQEPHRSVQLIRRIDSRVPSPLLSVAATASPSASTTHLGLGKLADLRAPALQQLPRPRVSPAPTPTPPPGSSSTRGWTSVVTRYPQPSPSPTAWSTPSGVKTPSRAAPSPIPVRPASAAPTPPVVPDEDVPANWEDEA